MLSMANPELRAVRVNRPYLTKLPGRGNLI